MPFYLQEVLKLIESVYRIFILTPIKANQSMTKSHCFHILLHFIMMLVLIIESLVFLMLIALALVAVNPSLLASVINSSVIAI